ncbi:MAG: transposase [Anaerovoracaceae bacterium]
MEALDEVRREAWREARSKAEAISGRVLKTAGRARADDPVVSAINRAKTQANDIKTSTFALGKAPENLTENQRTKLEMIQINNPRLYRAYRLKESLRLLLKLDDVQEAEKELNHWLQWASHSQIPSFKALYQKIKRHKEHILNTIRFGMSNARIESTNNKIKLLICKAYGFRNIQNMLDMVYLVCSNLTIPLPNRKPKAAKP